MSHEPRLRSLRLRHARLDDRIFDEDHRPSPDLSVLRRLKVEKLRIKEEIERLSHPA
ncbi:YdcH family protein [Gluconacetobacter sp. 1b LMG 1731]|uniref:YdcH family protein n=1 Tax=Gluconacetobacter dulcium TaxID=2729096 RepID=A0A7W4IIU2_9PROT|nr:YdcH family protein [Gluconacetobacter dulcium]MBB2163675.1 YdcH family protein [Gluconacetobacter dulcium]MBB2192911.1 YdcH family protein [Gluconacetobacter dulcium]MBB2198986.1 YdcH family protein [Gluconacetobacter dulcium]